ncbi:MAG: type II toxin-antitoxin system VapC family toxin [Planctomycetaceae bacterium]|nr:type II toxin-antitoxin system VapC family toxin [Planctomycetaceae bacterium]
MTLLDSQPLLWFDFGDPRLTARSRRTIETRANRGELLLSVASIWELAIKSAKGNLVLPQDFDAYIERCIREMRLRILDINAYHAIGVTDLPRHHRDPFDRMIISQATVEGIDVITGNRMFRRYGVRVIW